MKMKLFLAWLIVTVAAAPVFAALPDEMLADPVAESRARDISHNIRCLVCQGEAIDESNAELAGDLRRLVRQRIAAGDSDAQVYAYLQARYGDYILMKPPLNDATLPLWFLPPLVLLCGGIVAWFGFFRNPLQPDEKDGRRE